MGLFAPALRAGRGTSNVFERADDAGGLWIFLIGDDQSASRMLRKTRLSVKQDQDAGRDGEQIEDGAAVPEAEMKQRHEAFQDEPYCEQKHSHVLR